MKWYVEYFDEDGFWYLDGAFASEGIAQGYADKMRSEGYEDIKVYRA